MEVCEVCGAFLIVGDAQSRVDDHLMGKQHMGYAKIKSTVEELKVSQCFFHVVFFVCVLDFLGFFFCTLYRLNCRFSEHRNIDI